MEPSGAEGEGVQAAPPAVSGCSRPGHGVLVAASAPSLPGLPRPSLCVSGPRCPPFSFVDTSRRFGPGRPHLGVCDVTTSAEMPLANEATFPGSGAYHWHVASGGPQRGALHLVSQQVQRGAEREPRTHQSKWMAASAPLHLHSRTQPEAAPHSRHPRPRPTGRELSHMVPGEPHGPWGPTITGALQQPPRPSAGEERGCRGFAGRFSGSQLGNGVAPFLPRSRVGLRPRAMPNCKAGWERSRQKERETRFGCCHTRPYIHREHSLNKTRE